MSFLNTSILSLNKKASTIRTMETQGDIEPRLRLEQLYESEVGIGQDHSSAAHWLHKAAEQGNADAQYNLSIFYAYGIGVSQNHTEAAMWCHKAAEQGHVNAQFNLGIMYSLGNGVPRDLEQGALWCRKAAEQNHAQAQSELGMKYLLGEGVGQNNNEAIAWTIKAAKQGLAGAQHNLALMYKQGIGVPQDSCQAATQSHNLSHPDDSTTYNPDFTMEETLGSLLMIVNEDMDLNYTNYFHLPEAQQGLFYLSWNEKAARLLVPDSLQHLLDEIGTGKKVIIIQYLNAIEMVFDDNSNAPFSLVIPSEQAVGNIPEPTKDFLIIVYCRTGEKYRCPAELRLSKKNFDNEMYI